MKVSKKLAESSIEAAAALRLDLPTPDTARDSANVLIDFCVGTADHANCGCTLTLTREQVRQLLATVLYLSGWN